MSYQILFHDIQKTIEVPEGMTILEASERAGIDIPYSCRKGDCGTCTIRRIEGEVQGTGSSASVHPEQGETVLACVSHPRSDLVCHTTYEEKEWPARVVRVIPRTPDVQSYHLVLEEGGNFDFLPGQFVTLSTHVNERKSYRCYSISSSCFEKDYLEITVKRKPQGRVSSHLHFNLREGDTVHLKRPRGGFTLDPDSAEDVLLVGAGVGITPLMSMLRSRTATGSAGKIILLYGARSVRDLVFWNELKELERQNPNFVLRLFLSQPDPGWKGETGRIHEKAIAQSLTVLKGEVSVYTCGPESLMDRTLSCAKEQGIASARCHKEAFLPSRTPMPPHAATLEEVHSIDLFADLCPIKLEELLPHIVHRRYAPGEVIVREGEYGDSAFFILEGRARVYLEPLDLTQLGRKPQRKRTVFERLKALLKKNPRGHELITTRDVRFSQRDYDVDAYGCDREGRARHPFFLPETVLNRDGAPVCEDKTATLGPGELIGELSVLFRSYRTATVISDPGFDKPVHALEIKIQALRGLSRISRNVQKYIENHFRQQTLSRYVKNAELFAECGTGLQETLIRDAGLLSFKPGDRIVDENQCDDAFYIILAGFVRLSKKMQEKELNFDYLETGDFVGAAPLAEGGGMAYSATADNNVQVLRLDPELLQKLFAIEAVREKITWAARFRSEMIKSLETQVGDRSLLNYGIENQLLNGQSIMVINLDRCTRCDDCVQACADSHEGTPRFVREGSKFGNLLFPHACMHCQDPVCMIGCPSGALYRSHEKGEVLIDLDTCVGCTLCQENCIYDNIVSLPVAESVAGDGTVEYKTAGPANEPVVKAMKCDLCVETGSPACVRACPTDALHRLSFEEIFSPGRDAIAGTVNLPENGVQQQ